MAGQDGATGPTGAPGPAGLTAPVIRLRRSAAARGTSAQSLTAWCNQGEAAIAGGVTFVAGNPDDLVLVASAPEPQRDGEPALGWTVTVRSASPQRYQFDASVVCVSRGQ